MIAANAGGCKAAVSATKRSQRTGQPRVPHNSALKTQNFSLSAYAPNEPRAAATGIAQTVRSVGSIWMSAGPFIFAHQTPGMRRFVFALYATYSSPNASSIICSSARRRKANRIPKETRYEGPTTQFGTTKS